MNDASNVNVSYMDHTNSAFSSGGTSSSAREDSLASIIKDCVIQYEDPMVPRFSDEIFPDIEDEENN